MAKYLIRQDFGKTYVLTKWEDDMSSKPLEVYRLTINQSNKIACSCPSGRYRGYCKNTTMLREWISRGEPEMEFIDA